MGNITKAELSASVFRCAREPIFEYFRKYYNSDFTRKIVTDFSAQKLCFTWSHRLV